MLIEKKAVSKGKGGCGSVKSLKYWHSSIRIWSLILITKYIRTFNFIICCSDFPPFLVLPSPTLDLFRNMQCPALPFWCRLVWGCTGQLLFMRLRRHPANLFSQSFYISFSHEVSIWRCDFLCCLFHLKVKDKLNECQLIWRAKTLLKKEVFQDERLHVLQKLVNCCCSNFYFIAASNIQNS